MRWLCFLVVIACSAQPRRAAQPPAPVGNVDAWVLGAQGLVAGAEVRVVPLRAEPCPCDARDSDDGFDNAVPECRCPQALARWRQRTLACTWPTPATVVKRSDNVGFVQLPATAIGSMLEATAPSGVRWQRLSGGTGKDSISIGLLPPIALRLDVGTRADVRAALLFDDGHCMPFRRDGDTSWVTVAPVARDPDVWPVIVVEARGFAPVVRAWYESDGDVEIPLHAAQSIAGTCGGDVVRASNPFQQIVAKVDRTQRFSIDGAIDASTTVTCEQQGNVLDEWRFTHEDGLQEGGIAFVGYGGSCHDVDVVDSAGRPIAGAEVAYAHHPGVNGYGSTVYQTNQQGRACVENVGGGGELQVAAPPERGGWCAGETKLRVQPQHLAKPIRITLPLQNLPRAKFRGR